MSCRGAVIVLPPCAPLQALLAFVALALSSVCLAWPGGPARPACACGWLCFLASSCPGWLGPSCGWAWRPVRLVGLVRWPGWHLLLDVSVFLLARPVHPSWLSAQWSVWFLALCTSALSAAMSLSDFFVRVDADQVAKGLRESAYPSEWLGICLEICGELEIDTVALLGTASAQVGRASLPRLSVLGVSLCAPQDFDKSNKCSVQKRAFLVAAAQAAGKSITVQGSAVHINLAGKLGGTGVPPTMWPSSKLTDQLAAEAWYLLVARLGLAIRFRQVQKAQKAGVTNPFVYSELRQWLPEWLSVSGTFTEPEPAVSREIQELAKAMGAAPVGQENGLLPRSGALHLLLQVSCLALACHWQVFAGRSSV